MQHARAERKVFPMGIPYTVDPGRRKFLAGAGLAAVWFTVPGAFAQELAATPAQGEGPFYPDKLPLDTDNDLIIVRDSTTPAVGEITRLSGRVLDRRGDPVRGAIVEIWQVDNNGAYLHSGTQNAANRDKNFQGYGRFETPSSGEYQFRTIRPVAYSNRAPHIHVRVDVPRRHRLTTQLYIQGDPKNTADRLLNGVQDTRARNSLIVPFTPVPGSRIGELAARFDVVLGYTPAG
jgi:protocatechuate 3,4-dioxygenase beta subunit